MSYLRIKKNFPAAFLLFALALLMGSNLTTAQPVGSESRTTPPAAQRPAELSQFDFMLGNFSRIDRRRNTDGSWGEWIPGEWNTRYFMQGLGLIDETLDYQSGRVTSNVRIYNSDESRWEVTWFSVPDYGTLTATGGMQGDEMVLINTATGDRFVFSEITENSFVWTLEILIDDTFVPVREIRATRAD